MLGVTISVKGALGQHCGLHVVLSNLSAKWRLLLYEHDSRDCLNILAFLVKYRDVSDFVLCRIQKMVMNSTLWKFIFIVHPHLFALSLMVLPGVSHYLQLRLLQKNNPKHTTNCLEATKTMATRSCLPNNPRNLIWHYQDNSSIPSYGVRLPWCQACSMCYLMPIGIWFTLWKASYNGRYPTDVYICNKASQWNINRSQTEKVLLSSHSALL